MNDENFITVSGWMRNIPQIKNNSELLAYALIYGFSQAEGQYLQGNQAYIAEWLGMERHNCSTLLKKMEERKLIGKKLVKKMGAIRVYKYYAIVPKNTSTKTVHDEYQNSTRTCTKTVHATSTKTVHKKYNKNNNIDIYGRKSTNQFNKFMSHEDDYDFDQLEMDIVANVSGEKQ